MVGLALGMFGSFLLGYIIDDAMTEITVTVIVCFSSFIISEATTVRATVHTVPHGEVAPKCRCVYFGTHVREVTA